MPFAGYEDFDDCVAQNQDRDNPEAYCAAIQAAVEGDKEGRVVTQRKQVENINLGDEGTVAAAIATYNVIDKDGDVTQPGFFGEQPVTIVTSHDWGDVMLGKGVLRDTDGEAAIFEGKFNLDDPKAKALHSKLRFDFEHPPPLIEWSYAFDINEGGSSKGEFDNRTVRLLTPTPDGGPGAKVFEVSPVLRGAGEDTRTLAVKGEGPAVVTSDSVTADWLNVDFSISKDAMPKPALKFTEQIDLALAEVKTLLTRAEDVRKMRLEAGRGGPVGKEAVALLTDLDEQLARLKAVLTVPPASGSLTAAQAQFEDLMRRIR